MESRTYIAINGTRLYLDEGAFANNALASADGTSEQCEDCAADIMVEGGIVTNDFARTVLCSCGCDYLVEQRA